MHCCNRTYDHIENLCDTYLNETEFLGYEYYYEKTIPLHPKMKQELNGFTGHYNRLNIKPHGRLTKMKHNPFKIVRMFEEEIAEYAGSKYAVSVDSCTNALFLCCKYLDVKEVTIPCKTYLSVPMSVMHSGAKVVFDKTPSTNHWNGIINLNHIRYTIPKKINFKYVH